MDLELLPGLVVDPGGAFQAIPRLTISLTGASRASLVLGTVGRRARIAAAEGMGLPVGQILDLSSGMAAEVLESRRALLVSDLRDSPYPYHPERGYRTWSCMAAPVTCGGNPCGVLFASDPATGEAFAHENLESLQLLAGHVSSTLQAMLSAYAKSEVDDETGLCAPRVFRDRLSVELVRAARFGHPLSLLRLGIGQVEDSWQVGSRVLRESEVKGIARVLLETMRRTDLVARFGETEFAVILPETSAPQSLLAARRASQAVGEILSRTREGLIIPETVSVGLATLPPALTAEQLLEQAAGSMRVALSNQSTVHHWEIGVGEDAPQWLPCVCRFCGTTFPVATPQEQRARRFCSKTCTAAARRAAKNDRNRSIVAMRTGGATLKAIGDQFGITEERVRQICEAGQAGSALLMPPAKTPQLLK